MTAAVGSRWKNDGPRQFGAAMLALAVHGGLILAVAALPVKRVAMPLPMTVDIIDAATYDALTAPPDTAEAPEPPREAAPQPEPAPEPRTEPDPVPEPVAEPMPEPVPEPEPEPEPVAEPTPEPEPAPVPSPEAAPAPKPKPKPAPKPEPKPVPKPKAKRTPPPPSPAKARPAPSAAPATPPRAVAAAAPTYIAPNGDAAYLNNPKPLYPRQARRRGMQGVVVLRVEVSPDGVPVSVLVHESSGHSVLDRSARRTVMKWRFVPAQRAGVAVFAVVEVPIRFTLARG